MKNLRPLFEKQLKKSVRLHLSAAANDSAYEAPRLGDRRMYYFAFNQRTYVPGRVILSVWESELEKLEPSVKNAYPPEARSLYPTLYF